MTQQTEAQRLAELCEGSANVGSTEPWTRRQAAAELRRLDAVNKQLLEAIEQTIEENGHLADGENCTLIVLVKALAATKENT